MLAHLAADSSGRCCRCHVHHRVWRTVVHEIGASRGPGAIIGEIGILSRTRSRTATVRTDCLLWRLAAVKAHELWFQHPSFALHLAEVLADRLIDDLGPRSPEGGLAPTAA